MLAKAGASSGSGTPWPCYMSYQWRLHATRRSLDDIQRCHRNRSEQLCSLVEVRPRRKITWCYTTPAGAGSTWCCSAAAAARAAGTTSRLSGAAIGADSPSI